jgi:hypothetical protein
VASCLNKIFCFSSGISVQVTLPVRPPARIGAVQQQQGVGFQSHPPVVLGDANHVAPACNGDQDNCMLAVFSMLLLDLFSKHLERSIQF